jgi:hypothetical protein
MSILVKHCKFCDKSKKLNEFANNKLCILGVSNKCKECTRNYRKNYNKINKVKILEYNINFNKTYNSKWAKLNPHIIKWRDCLKSTLKYKETNKITKTVNLLGYTHQQFKEHIENQFTKGMTWDSIHVDHKIPLTWFKKETPISIINHLSNLQPLFAKDNISKSNNFSHEVDKKYFKLAKPFLVPPAGLSFSKYFK